MHAPVSFYPGPSKLLPQVRSAMLMAYDTGILSVNHRSPVFIDIWTKACEVLRDKLHIPQHYTIAFAASASQCWDMVLQAAPDRSTHLFNGAFGEKWSQIALGLGMATHRETFDENVIPQVKNYDTPLLCLTRCETSNGSVLPDNYLSQLRQANPRAVIAVDDTSAMAVHPAPWQDADIWFASVQKGLGLPAGMAVMVADVDALRAKWPPKPHRPYISLMSVLDQAEKHAPHHTPNMMGIWLLAEVWATMPDVATISTRLRTRATDLWEAAVGTPFHSIITEPNLRSTGVTCFQGIEADVIKVKKNLLEQGILAGNGYGAWKTNTFRLANFAAHTDEEVSQALAAVKSFTI